ncbi:MAG TPA: hypothetical protein ENK57_00395, partial [Polyangiaceae bacterium]|nr:hypothetical protein [Polyangiaceae bacterium]
MPAARLGVIDRFHAALDREARHAGVGPGSCALVAELEGRADADRLRARVDDAVRRIPELRWRLGRDRALQLVWREQPETRPTVEIVEVDAPWMAVAEERLARDDLSGAVPWRLELWRGSERDALALRWFHPLADALGAVRLLAWLGGEERDPPEERFDRPEQRVENEPFGKRLALTRRYREHALAVAQQGSIVSPRRLAGGRAGRSRCLRWRFTAEETAAFVASLRSRARLADTSLLLRASALMWRRLLTARGAACERHVVPVPLSLDKKRGATRMFGNHVTMLMLGVDDATLDDEPATVAALAAQQRQIVKDELDQAMLASLHSLRFVPDAASQWLAKSPFDGQRCSFILSNPGPIVLGRLAGRDVTDAFLALAATPDPGLVVVGQRFADRMS